MKIQYIPKVKLISSLLFPSLFLLFLLLINSCGPSFRIQADYDKTLNIRDYKTYSWLPLKEIEGKGLNPVYYNELTDKRIKNAINKEMMIKGYRLIEGSNTELELHYHIVVENKTTIVEGNDKFKDTPYWQTRKVYTYEYREGSLIIDMMDVKTKALIWRGTAKAVVTEKASKNPEESINKAVSAIYKLFPYTSL